tara:strand:+ start:1355 stop:2017 length:663 start_codon:yes stop_codon:yes gene_type:complete
MDAKGIWNTANSRTINSSTHKVMKRPKQSDFTGPNRKVRNKKYQDALRKYRDFLAKQKKEKIDATTKQTSRGRRPLNATELKKKNAEKTPKGPYAADRVGTVDKESKAYKEAKRINESIPISSTKKKEEKPKVEKTEEKKTEAPKVEKTEEKKTEAPKTEAPKKKTQRERFNEKFIRTKGGKLARRGTLGARRAENREAARKRAQAAAKLRIKKKKEKKS